MRFDRPAALPPPASRQRGAIAIIVGLSLVVMLGAMGLAIDGGRLYVNKAELQSAADACALAAAGELVCDATVGTCPATYLNRAQAAGVATAGKDKANLQATAVSIAASDVRFSTTLGPNANYVSIAGGASNASRFAMCIARTNGITPWLMGLLGIGASNVSATGVATLSASGSFCSTAPIGVCEKNSTGPNYGYSIGEWLTANFNGNGNDVLSGTGGTFRWVTFPGSNNGTTEINDQLVGTGQICGMTAATTVTVPGNHQGAKSAYNTRFGLYPNGANAYDATTAPPDRSGYAYPNKSPGSPVIPVPAAGSTASTAYADFRSRQTSGQASSDAFIQQQYANNNPSGNVNSTSDYVNYGGERRLITAPMIDCSAGGAQVPATMVCVLMLNPMANGNGNQTIYTEYRGLASSPSSPCRTSGLAAPGGTGPLVPALVQ